MKISFIGGAGRTGSAAAYCVGLNSIFTEILIFDKKEQKARGIATDLEQAFILANKNINVTASFDYNDIKGSDVIVITASIPFFTMEENTKNNTDKNADLREEMLSGNKQIIIEIANNLKKVIPTDDKQPLIIVLTNPMDIILSNFLRVGNFNKKKTIGSGNWLDTSRFKYYFSKEYDIPPTSIECYAVAQHGAKIVYLLSQTRINGIPLFDYAQKHNISREKIDEIVEKARIGGNQIIADYGFVSSTTWGPGVSLFELVDAYIKDKKKILVASIWCNGEYGVKDFAFGCPIILGKNGVEKILELDLDENDRQKYNESYKFAKTLDDSNK
jgi:malate dehydrogenase